jgi:copper chaperone NosL
MTSNRPPAPRARRAAGFAAALLTALLLAACSAPPSPPQAIGPGTLCVLDGMALAEFPGPKGQIVYDHGEPDYFCNTTELLAAYLDPAQQRRVVGVYTQDMGATDWTRPDGNWIDARGAFYVVGSRREGSMGPTLASLGTQAGARDFAARYGGRVLAFRDVTPAVVAEAGMAVPHGRAAGDDTPQASRHMM